MTILTETFGEFSVTKTGLYVIEVSITLVKETLLASGIRVNLFEVDKPNPVETEVLDYGVWQRTDGLKTPLGIRKEKYSYRKFFEIIDEDINRGTVENYDGNLNKTIVDSIKIREATEQEVEAWNS